MYLEPVNLIQVTYTALAILGLVLVSHTRRFSALSLLLGLQAALMVFNFLEETGISKSYYLITPIFTLSFGPAIFLFVRQLVYEHFPPHRQLALHLSPMLLTLPLTHWPQLVIGLGSISQVVYLTASILLVRRYHRVSFQVQSDAHGLKLNWLNTILCIFLFMMLQDLLRLNLQPYAPIGLLKRWYLLNTAVDFMLSAYLIIKAVKQPALFEQMQEFEEIGAKEPPPKSQEATDPEASAIFLQIDQLIRAEELFKQSRLSLRDLAEISGINEKNLSWAINQGSRQSFCEYINGLRVHAVCVQLQTYTGDRSILDIAYAMGFSAKSTFNTVFKKETGLTPTQFANNVSGSLVLRSES